MPTSTARGPSPTAPGAASTAGTCSSPRPAGRRSRAGSTRPTKLNEEALAINRRHGEDCWQEYTVGTLVLARQRWRPHDADAAQLRGFAARYPHLPVWEAMLASPGVGAGGRRGGAARGRALRARRLRGGRALARLPARRALPGRGGRGRGRARGGVGALRAAAAVRGDEPGARAAVGRVRARRARARAAGRGRRPPRRRGGALRRGQGAGGRRGARPGGSCGRSGTGSRPAFRCPIAASSSTAGSSSRASSACRTSRRGSPTRLRSSRRSSRSRPAAA